MHKMVVRIAVLVLSIGIVGYFVWAVRPLIAQIYTYSGSWEFYSEQGFSQFENPEGPVQVHSTYRGGAQRWGYFESSQFHLPLKTTWSSDNIFADIHPASKATPAVDDSGIYLGTDLGIFYKFSHDGKVLWSFTSESAGQGIHGTALLDDKYVYFGNYAGKFYCLDKKDGRLIWANKVAHAVGSSPFVFQNSLFFSAEFNNPKEGYLVRLQASSGEKQWVSSFFNEQVHSSPTLDEKNRIIGVGTNAYEYLGIDEKTGQILWHYKTAGPIKGTAVFVNNMFCFGSWDKYLHCINSFDGKKVFSVELNGASQSSAALDPKNDNLYISSASGDLFKISLKSQKILNQVSLKMQGKTNRFSMPSPIVVSSKAGSYIVSACNDDNICIFNGTDLRLLQMINVGGLVTGSFVIYEGTLYANVNNRGLVRLN